MKSKSIYALLMGVLFTFACSDRPKAVQSAQQINNDTLPSEQLKEDAEFITEYSYDLMTSTELAKVVINRTTNPGLRNFAEKVLSDNLKIENKLLEVTTRTGITLPSQLNVNEEALVNSYTHKSVDLLYVDYINWFIQHTNEAKNGVDKVIANTNKTESILELANLISSTSFAQIELAKSLATKSLS